MSFVPTHMRTVIVKFRVLKSDIMLRLATLFTLTVALTSAAGGPVSNVFQIDISPEEAQKYLSSPPFTEPQLSGRTAVLPLVRWNDPRFRSVEPGPTLGHYWKNGHEIENTEDYLEEVYDASQFHGQDGLGAYTYGYQAPESAKVENRVRAGDVTGSYTYKDGNNELIKVRYWADSQGFHQEDNLPKVKLQPIPEAEDVRQARIAHEKAWQEAAAAAAQQPDPQGAYYNRYDAHSSPSEPQPVIAPAPGQYAQASEVNQVVAPREGKAYFAQSQSGFQQQQYGQQQNKQLEEPEPTGPPRGFFYSFTYPVSVIVPKSGAQPGAVNPGQPVDHDTVGVYSQH